MSDKKQWLGKRGESLAADKLRSLGYDIIARNFRCAYGEVDIVARHGDAVVFVEVRARRGDSFGTPAESVTPQKKQRLIATAQTFLQQNQLSESSWRIDFVSVQFQHGESSPHIEVIENAIGG